MAVRLEGSELVLAVWRAKPGGPGCLKVQPSITVALANWGASTRASSIYPIDKSVWPNREAISVWFVGPVFPGECPHGVPAFLSMGIYNLVLVAASDAQHEVVAQFLAKRTTVTWEKWSVSAEGQITEVGYAPLLHEDVKHDADAGDINLTAGLRSAAEEYRTLVAATVSKAATYLPAVATEIATFDKVFRRTLESEASRPVVKFQWLVNVNAALSRFSSQTFAGISPIAGTECHYWTHSLLGVGLASQALLAIRRHVQRAFLESDIPGRLRALANKPAHNVLLEKLRPSHGFWAHHYIEKLPQGAKREQLPQIVCFSGRDGFRSTTHTLSVPLEVISAANTVGWTMRTVTHELSHLFVDAILAALLPGVPTDAGAQELFDAIDAPTNLLTQVQRFFGWHLCQIANQGKDLDFSAKLLQTSVQVTYPEISELLTHIFDFLYFYKRDPAVYIAAIWGSWDVIPNISDRIDDYILRTVCAVMVLNLQARDPSGVSMRLVSDELSKLRKRLQDTNILDEAVDKLENHADEFRPRLSRLMSMVAMCNAFLYAPDVALLISRSFPSARNSPDDFKSGTFDQDIRVDNPVRFVYEQSAKGTPTNDPDFRTSAWMMAQLAFSTSDDA